MAASRTAADWAFTGPSSHSRACSRACRISGQLLDRGRLDISLGEGCLGIQIGRDAVFESC